MSPVSPFEVKRFLESGINGWIKSLFCSPHQFHSVNLFYNWDIYIQYIILNICLAGPDKFVCLIWPQMGVWFMLTNSLDV